MTYLYVSSRFANSILGSSHNNQNIDFEQVQDLEKSEDLNQHQSKLLHTYSSVPNTRACTFINFEKKIPPVRPYFGLHVY